MRFGLRDELALCAGAMVAGLSMMSSALLYGWTAAPSLGLILVIWATGRLIRALVSAALRRWKRP
jgi:hypothetical protein